jgi:NAD(P)-dependent dehydrogenase (short-subunit alcohol dehydrogenase family)
MDRIAIVMGGGTGIGRATAEKLSATGYRAICRGLDRDEARYITGAILPVDGGYGVV